mmetsp:Transcript_9411/g.18653  ORF Transcript_9411/g.18653 Transcript_9411/m.18653 type:complete len:120 (+) Transcript_9411:1989-2348(+)
MQRAQLLFSVRKQTQSWQLSAQTLDSRNSHALGCKDHCQEHCPREFDDGFDGLYDTPDFGFDNGFESASKRNVERLGTSPERQRSPRRQHLDPQELRSGRRRHRHSRRGREGCQERLEA